MKLTLPWPPSVNDLYMNRKGGKGRGRILTVEGRGYKQLAAALAMKAGMRPITGDVAVKMVLYRPRKSGDIDNFSKAVFDSLKGIAWNDDGQVCDMHVIRRDDKIDPRVEIEVEPCAAREAA